MGQHTRMRGPIPPRILRFAIAFEKPYCLQVLQELNHLPIQEKPFRQTHFY
jgi:hypothetical protein